MKKWWLGLVVLAALPARAQMTAVSALVQDANGERYVNCTWSVVFDGQNPNPGAGPYQPAALLVGQQGQCDSSGNLRVSLADNIATIRPTPSQWRFSICSAPGYIPGGTYCRSNMLVTITGLSQDLTSFFKPLMPLLPTGGGGGGGTGYITDATPLGGLMKTGTTLGLQTTCIQGQYLGWTGTSWACTTPGGGGGGGSGTSVTVNGTMPIPNSLNFNSAAPLPPPNGQNIIWNLNGTNVSGSIVGDGNPNSCLIGTGIFAACPGGGGGGGGGTPLPTIPQYNLYASNGSGGAQDSGAKAGLPGFLETEVLLATGDVTSQSAPFQLFPNASVEYFPTGYAWSGGTAGAAHGLAMYMSHSAGSTASANGGVALGGGNSSSTGNQVYLDCETTGCSFKVPIYEQTTLVAGRATPRAIAGVNTFNSPVQMMGFSQAYVVTAIGDQGSLPSPFGSTPNASVEYFPTGFTTSQGHFGGPNGLAAYFSHSGVSGSNGNGGVALGGGNNSGTGYQIYLDCEIAACEFREPITINDGTNNGIAMMGVGGSLPTVAPGSGGIGIGPGGIPQYNANGAGWLNIGSGGTGGTVNWGSIGGTLSTQSDLMSALNGKIGLTSTLTPVTCPGGQAAGGILSNGNATGCFTPAGGGGGGAGTPNQSVSFTSATTASLTVASATTALVWACWDGPTFPANAIYPSNVTVSSSGLVTFTFAVQQTGYCVVNSSGAASTPVSFTAATTATVTAGNATPIWSCWDSNSPANSIYPSNVSVDPATFLVTFTFAVPQTGQCVVSGGIGGGGGGGGITGVTPSQGLAATGTTIGLQSCAANQILQSAGTTWGCIATPTGGAGPTIYTCTIAADVPFSTTQGTICSQALGATARQWRLHCSLPWNFTGGSGTSNVVIGINLSATPSYQTYVSPVMWNTTGSSNMGAISVTASGNTPVITANGLTAGAGGTIFTVNIDGTVAAAANTTIYIYGTASGTGTAAFRPGVTCELI